MSDTVGDLDVQVFEETFSFDTEPCSLGDCKNPATWFLLCPFDRSAETVCEQHHAEMLGWPEDYPIRFDGTCNHNPEIGQCLWEPYTG